MNDMAAEQTPNMVLYETRKEPDFLRPIGRNALGPIYVNLRTTEDVGLLRRTLACLEGQFAREGKEHVLLTWFSEPFGRIKGYGIYTKEEAEELQRRQEEERWETPHVSYIKDVGLLRVWIEKKEKRSLEARL